MATTTRTSDSGDTTAAAAPAVVEYGAVWPRPIVYEYRRGGRRKKRYSKCYKDGQLIERDVSRAAERAGDALSDGFRRYRRERNRSARRKKDGAIKDFARNVGRGLERALRTGSRVPSDLTRRATTKRLKKVSRML